MNRPALPNKPLAALILGTVPIKLVTQHQPRNKTRRWNSRLLTTLSSCSQSDWLFLSLSLPLSILPLETPPPGALVFTMQIR